jgi:hypothetical protein
LREIIIIQHLLHPKKFCTTTVCYNIIDLCSGHRATLCGGRGYGLYGDEGGKANKEKGQHMFSNQFGFIFISIDTESKERVGCPTKALYAYKGRTT